MKTSKLHRAYRRAALMQALAEGPQTQRALAERLNVSRKMVTLLTRRPDIETYAGDIGNRMCRMYRLHTTPEHTP